MLFRSTITLTAAVNLTYPQPTYVSTQMSRRIINVATATTGWKASCLSNNAGLHAYRTPLAQVRVSTRAGVTGFGVGFQTRVLVCYPA